MAKKSKKGKSQKKQNAEQLQLQVERTPVPTALEPRREDGTLRSRGSKRQIQWINDMLDGKVLEASSVFAARVADLDKDQKKQFIESLRSQLPEMSYDGINQMIGALKVLPEKQPKGGTSRVPEPRDPTASTNGRVQVKYENVPTDQGTRRMGRAVLPSGEKVLGGSYGIKTKKDERFANDVSFFKVWIGDRGGWRVQYYVSDDLHRVQLSVDTQIDILKKIAKNPAKAAARFGHEFGHCAICGRGLTNDESRERGIGPVCAERL